MTTTTNFLDTLTLVGGGVSCNPGSVEPVPRCNGSPNGPSSLDLRISSANPPAFVGLTGGNTWAIADAGGTVRDTIPGVFGGGWPVIDGSSPPLVYLAGLGGTPGRIEPRVIKADATFGPAPFVLPVLPFAIFDRIIATSGILYALSADSSGSQITVFAMITDSAGGATAAGGTQTAAWPAQCRDPCRSSNAGVQCPF